MITRLFLLLALSATGRVLADDTTPAAPGKPVATTATPAPSPVTAAPLPRKPATVAPVVSFETYRSIGERNIFDANRRGRSRSSDDVVPPKLDTISFVGTMDYEKGVLAFFDGSEASYRKTLSVGQSVDKFKVTNIAPDSVDLERDGKPLSMRLAQQLRRPEGGDWTLVGADVVRNEAAARSGDPSRPDPTALPVIPANADEVTRRLMERRLKELKQ